MKLTKMSSTAPLKSNPHVFGS